MIPLRSLFAIIVVGCAGPSSTGDDDPDVPLAVSSISPSVGSVAGGTLVTLSGSGMRNVAITIGGVPCSNVSTESTARVSCMTGSVD